MATKTKRTKSFLKKGMLKLDPNCVVARGYLVKSPPRDKILRNIARWHLRWFVLYDTKERCLIDPALEREIILYYFANEHDKNTPLGFIQLIGAGVRPHNGKIRDYEYAIDVITDKRTWHLCSTSKPVHELWLAKLREHCVQSSPRNSNTESPRHKMTASLPKKKREMSLDLTQFSTPKTRQVSKSPFSAAANFFETAPLGGTKITSCSPLTSPDSPIVRTPVSTTPQMNITEGSMDEPVWNYHTETHSKHLSAKATLSTFPCTLLEECDKDEGISRTSSESSWTSTSTRNSSTNSTSLVKSTLPTSRYDSDEIFGRGTNAFQGPKLIKSKSMADLLSDKSLKSPTNTPITHPRPAQLPNRPLSAYVSFDYDAV